MLVVCCARIHLEKYFSRSERSPQVQEAPRRSQPLCNSNFSRSQPTMRRSVPRLARRAQTLLKASDAGNAPSPARVAAGVALHCMLGPPPILLLLHSPSNPSPTRSCSHRLLQLLLRSPCSSDQALCRSCSTAWQFHRTRQQGRISCNANPWLTHRCCTSSYG